MKLRSLFFGTLCMLMLGVSFTSCSDDDDDSKKNDEGSKMELPENRVYILNMGSYQCRHHILCSEQIPRCH